eukprot:jgi/Astpho2/8897/e_gw1.00132.45.1_t
MRLPYDPHNMRLPKLVGAKAFTILSWNVNSIKTLLNKKPYIFEQLELEEKADVFCLQETLLQKVDGQLEWNLQLPGWHMLWSCSEWPAALGRAVRLLSRRGNSWLSWQLEPWQASPLMTNDHMEHEGRTITAEFKPYYIVSAYFPNSGKVDLTCPLPTGHDLKRLDARTKQWDEAFRTHVGTLQETKHVIVMGELLCLVRWDALAGPMALYLQLTFWWLQTERESLKVLLQSGLTDTFRHQFPKLCAGYTYWKQRYRTENRGWRLDYALVSDGLVGNVYETFHRPDVMGSDHCPIGITLLHA